MSHANDPPTEAKQGPYMGAPKSTTAVASSNSSAPSLSLPNSNTADLKYNINRYQTSSIYSTPPFHREKDLSDEKAYEPGTRDELARELAEMGDK